MAIWLSLYVNFVVISSVLTENDYVWINHFLSIHDSKHTDKTFRPVVPVILQILLWRNASWLCLRECYCWVFLKPASFGITNYFASSLFCYISLLSTSNLLVSPIKLFTCLLSAKTEKLCVTELLGSIPSTETDVCSSGFSYCLFIFQEHRG